VPPVEPQPERLGSFFLGAEYDAESAEITGDPIHYDARDLTTHGVCVGMTGSGKTGLCVGLLEEAALDRVPAIIIDPKGDMGNLLLHFEDLAPEDFAPWVNVDDARRKELSLDEYAEKMARLWESGLGDWGIGKDRIRSIDESVEYQVYTPGSSAVRPLNVLGSFEPPADATEEETHERSSGIVSALLGLVGIEADPVTSREATFLAVLIEYFWNQGVVPDIAHLVRSIPDPPVRQFGVFDVDSFFPEKDRFDLAMRFNNLLASPNFSAWLQGGPLDIDSLLYSDEGKPRHSILYIAHLSDEERMFFVTLLLENLVSWMRRQPGTTSLRALLYFDEIFGFLPPVAEPPSKRALLTILKQGRAFGLGALLVTQNPVDLDYKALSNAGTWFIGRLQSEQDQRRLLDGLKGASSIRADGGGNRLESAIGKLKSRVFLLHNVHEDGPVLFHTRWAMNYLRGPLTRRQLRDLPGVGTADRPESAARPDPERARTESARAESRPGVRSERPAMPQGVKEVFLKDSSRDDTESTVLSPVLGAHAVVSFYDRKYAIETSSEELLLLDDLSSSAPDWEDARVIPAPFELDSEEPASGEPDGSLRFEGQLPASANTAREIGAAERSLKDHLYRARSLELKVVPSLDVCQRPDESDASFFARVELAAREERDGEIDALVDRYRVKIERLEDRLRAKEMDVSDREADVSSRQQEEWVRLGESVLGMFLGSRSRRALSGSASKRRMTTRARQRLERALSEADDLREDVAELRAESEEKAREISDRWSDLRSRTEILKIKPRRTDIEVAFVGIVWV